MQFCEKIIRLRKGKRMSQEALAEAVGVSRQAVYKWECGQSYPEAMKLVALKELFGISVDDLLDEGFEVPLPVRTVQRRARKVTEEAVATKAAEEAAPAAEEKAQETEQTPAEEPSYEEVAATEPAPSTEEVPTQTEAKRKGFFRRLFGR